VNSAYNFDMARERRVNIVGALYHLIQRGNNKNYIFEDNIDKMKFLSILDGLQKKYGFLVLFYVIMDNHYHLVIKTGSVSTGKIMQELHMSYTRYYNNRHNRTGTIYEGRYKGILIATDKQFYELLRYLAYNPMRAGMVNRPDDYLWSAHPYIQNNIASIVSQSETLSYFGDDIESARKAYTIFIENPDKKTMVGLVMAKSDPQRDTFILNSLFDTLKLSSGDQILIKSRDRNIRIMNIRNEFIKLAIRDGVRIKAIAGYLSISCETVRFVGKGV